LGRRSRKRASRSAAEPQPVRRGSTSGEKPPRGRARSEARNAAVRASLEPLEPGERPTAVTIGALVAGTLALANLVAYLAGVKINGERPAIGGIVIYEALLLTAAVGMWRARYWAVLGFEFMLGFLLVILALLLVRASNVLGVVVVLAIGIPAGWLFWKLVRSMARLQMPERPGAPG
jgi:hypothetical protein